MRALILFLLLVPVSAFALSVTDCKKDTELVPYESVGSKDIEVVIQENYEAEGCDLINIVTAKEVEGYSSGSGVSISAYGHEILIMSVSVAGGENSLGRNSAPFIACQQVDRLQIRGTYGKYCKSKTYETELQRHHGKWPGVYEDFDAVPANGS